MCALCHGARVASSDCAVDEFIDMEDKFAAECSPLVLPTLRPRQMLVARVSRSVEGSRRDRWLTNCWLTLVAVSKGSRAASVPTCCTSRARTTK